MVKSRQMSIEEIIEQERHDFLFEEEGRDLSDEEFEALFGDDAGKGSKPEKRTKNSVRVSRNKSGEERYCIRFGFVGKAAETVGECQYIEPSKIKRLKKRIYFRFHESKENRDCFKVCRTDGKGVYFTFTPDEREDILYQAHYVGKVLEFKYDEGRKCHYITIEEE